MKTFLKIAALLLIAPLLILPLSSCRLFPSLFGKSRETSGEETQKYLYLAVGIDDAAENTDVMFTVGYDAEANRIYAVQLPRDTFFRSGSFQNKLNQFFAARRKSGRSRKEALADLAHALERLFGIRFNGCFALDTEAFAATVDAVGGVDIRLDEPKTLYLAGEKLELAAGESHLDGRQAEMFVRSRKGYAHGDLDRLDTQKIFLSAFLDRIREGFSLPEMISAAKILLSEAVTDLELSDVVPFLTLYKNKLPSAETEFYTLPGKPLLSPTHLSYYVIERDPAAKAAKQYMFASSEFDPDRKLKNQSYPGFAEVYGDER